MKKRDLVIKCYLSGTVLHSFRLLKSDLSIKPSSTKQNLNTHRSQEQSNHTTTSFMLFLIGRLRKCYPHLQPNSHPYRVLRLLHTSVNEVQANRKSDVFPPSGLTSIFAPHRVTVITKSQAAHNKVTVNIYAHLQSTHLALRAWPKHVFPNNSPKLTDSLLTVKLLPAYQ